MNISFQRVSNTEHTLAITRDDGSTECVTCETRSYLDHDFIHLAVEAEANLSDGFWGTLQAGTSLAVLNDRNDGDASDPLMDVERLIGAMTGALGSLDDASAASGCRSYLQQLGVEASFVTADFMAGARQRLRRLRGQWRATGFHEAMVVQWPPLEAPNR